MKAAGTLRVLCLAATALGAAASGVAQTPSNPATPAPTPDPAEAGIPIPDTRIQQACAPCHSVDAKQRISRLSFRRTTPEGWQESLKRMVSLNGLNIDPEDARYVVKYLSDNLGLAPEEVQPAEFELERRLVDYKYPGDRETEKVCSACHSIGRVLLQRRTKEEWDLLVAMHRGYYPIVDFQAFRRMGPPPRQPGPDGRPPDKRHPMEKALEHLKSAFPLRTAEWAAWAATQRSPRLEGVWALAGYEAGKGPLFGTVTMTSAGQDEFVTEASYVYARDGSRVTRRGKGLVYTGFQWRGRSTEAAGSGELATRREVMHLARDWRTMRGRWYTGPYEELGIDVRLTRTTGEPMLLGVDRRAAALGKGGFEVRIFGANLPTANDPRAIDFGDGIRVQRITAASADVVTALLDVAPNARVGPRDLFVAGATLPAALTVYDRIGSIRVTPEWNMARLGGAAYPPMTAQFEAIAYHNGADAKAGTKDDVLLGPVEASWSLEEYAATYDDDDVRFVGTLDPKTGHFTPNLDGPNPKRSGERNNVGDVWVVATLPVGPAGTPTLRARAHLLVTVPLYMRWDFSVTPEP